jgi:putative FmdB family regulatory protein
MPLYEYFCKHCDGVFESVKPMAKASEPAPCPLCERKAQRIPPTSFNARTMRDGYPRAIPDRGTYWHLGKEVKSRNTGGVPMNEHPELYKPKPKPRLSKGEREILADKQRLESKEEARKLRDGAPRIIDRTKRLPKVIPD